MQWLICFLRNSKYVSNLKLKILNYLDRVRASTVFQKKILRKEWLYFQYNSCRHMFFVLFAKSKGHFCRTNHRNGANSPFIAVVRYF